MYGGYVFRALWLGAAEGGAGGGWEREGLR